MGGLKLAPNIGMIRSVDDFIEALLKDTPADNLDDRRETAAVAIKWIAVRHKLADMEDMHGSGLSSYREAIAGKDGPGGTAKPGGRKRADPAEGAELSAFRQRLPDAGVGDVLDARKGAGGPGDSAARNGGGVRSGVHLDGVSNVFDDGPDSDL